MRWLVAIAALALCSCAYHSDCDGTRIEPATIFNYDDSAASGARFTVGGTSKPHIEESGR